MHRVVTPFAQHLMMAAVVHLRRRAVAQRLVVAAVVVVRDEVVDGAL